MTKIVLWIAAIGAYVAVAGTLILSAVFTDEDGRTRCATIGAEYTPGGFEAKPFCRKPDGSMWGVP